MNGKILIATLFAAAFGGGAALVVADDMTPRPQREFTEKPRIEDYADYNTFLVDIMEYRRQKENADNRIKARNKPNPAPAAAASAEPQVTIDAYGRVTAAVDPGIYKIEGPETLDEALKRASKLPHPFYAQAERFGRSTSFSFPLPPMDGDDMSLSEVEGKLQDLESLHVEVYEDEGAPRLADTISSDNPSNSDETAEKTAYVAGNGIYHPDVDLDARTAVDSNGDFHELPLVLKNEVDYTVVRLNVTVGTTR